MKGAMMHGLSGGVFLDDKRFWPIYERAERLDVPIYFHPATPDARVGEVYYNDYAKDFPMVVRAAWGYTVETATTAIRMILFPGLAFASEPWPGIPTTRSAKGHRTEYCYITII